MTPYKGEKSWAPCFHGDTEKEQTREYVRSVLAKGEDEPHFLSGNFDVEDILWELGLNWYYGGQPDEVADLKWGFYADQWIGVAVEVHFKGQRETEYLWTEADNFALGMARSIERLKEKGYIRKIEADSI